MMTSLETIISVCLHFKRRFTTGSIAGLANGAASHDTKWVLSVLMDCDLWEGTHDISVYHSI